MKKLNPNLYFLGTFIILFVLYHLAEYQVMFTYKPAIFIIIQLLFLFSAYVLGKFFNKNGFKTWGLYYDNKTIRNIILGIILGVLLYTIPFLIGLYLGIDYIKHVPTFGEILPQLLLMALGLFFSSISEDILTRGIIYAKFRNQLNPISIVLLSATVFVLNHIYRLSDNWETLLYLFMLGVVLYIPILITNKLWMTVFMHWAGNLTFYITHEIIKTESKESTLGFNTLLILTSLIFSFFLGYRFYSKKKTFVQK